MATRATRPVDDDGEPASSPWRLFNLSLGISAALGVFGISANLLAQVPSRWILSPWYSSSSLETLSVSTKMAAQIGLNLWLPASVLVLVLILCGFGRRLDAPRSRLATASLFVVWLTYAALIVTWSLLSEEFGRTEASGAVGLIAGLFALPIAGVLLIVGTLAALAELMAMLRFRDASQFARVSKSWFAWALIPPALLVLPLLFAPSRPLALTASRSSEFEALCATTGVRFMNAPAGPVRSIAYDWDPERMQRPFAFYSLDGRGNFAYGGRGAWGGPGGIQKGREQLVFDFTESRQDGWCHSDSEIPTPYAHCPSVRSNIQDKAPYYGIDTFTADVVANFDVDDPARLGSKREHEAVRFEARLTDRRSGALLGEMSYVVDRANGRGCGANFGHDISLDAFIWDAIHR